MKDDNGGIVINVGLRAEGEKIISDDGSYLFLSVQCFQNASFAKIVTCVCRMSAM